MHVVDRTDAFTLVGSDARRGKLTLFAAEGPREQGSLKHVALRVSSLERAERELRDGLEIERPRDGEIYFDVSEGLRLGLVEAPTEVDYDLDHVALWSATPRRPPRPTSNSGSCRSNRAPRKRRASKPAGRLSSSIAASPAIPSGRC